MHLLSSIIFAATVNIDNFAVGVAYGIKKIKIGILSNLIIALISGTGTFLSMSLGLFINKIIPSAVSNLLGSIILIGIGFWFIIDFLYKNFKKKVQNSYDKNNHFICIEILDNPEKADTDKSGHIDNKESIALALALSLNNLGLGMGSSISGANIIVTSLLTFIFSIPTIIIGYNLGNSIFSKLFREYTSLISGIIIVLFGLFELFVW